MWYMNTGVMSSSKTCGHVDIQVRSNVVLGTCMHVVRINRRINYETAGLDHKYTGIWYTLSHVSIQFQM
jgi:hypothetical protein